MFKLIRKLWNKQTIEPIAWADILLLYISPGLLTIIVGFVIGYIKPAMTLESARLAIGAQITSTATILGLYIAAIVFHRRTVFDREQILRSQIDGYIGKLAVVKIHSCKGHTRVIDLTYNTLYEFVSELKAHGKIYDSELLVNLGKLFAIRELTTYYTSQPRE